MYESITPRIETINPIDQMAASAIIRVTALEAEITDALQTQEGQDQNNLDKALRNRNYMIRFGNTANDNDWKPGLFTIANRPLRFGDNVHSINGKIKRAFHQEGYNFDYFKGGIWSGENGIYVDYAGNQYDGGHLLTEDDLQKIWRGYWPDKMGLLNELARLDHHYLAYRAINEILEVATTL